jgi:hypothetical protein
MKVMWKHFFLLLIIFLVGCSLELSEKEFINDFENNYSEEIVWDVCFESDTRVFGIVEEGGVSKSYYLKDICKNEFFDYEDSNELITFGCERGSLYTKTNFCISGCIQDSCVHFSSCTDTDEGKDYYTSGKVVVTDKFGNEDVLEDVCFPGNKLTELSCISSEEISVEEKFCPFGCVQGKCLKERDLLKKNSSKPNPPIPQKLLLDVVPNIASSGTDIKVTLNIEGINISNPKVILKTKSVKLYDDGFHGDGLANDHFYATTTNFQDPGKYSLGVSYDSLGKENKLYDVIDALIIDPVSDNCQLLIPSEKQRKINVVITAIGYENERLVIDNIIDYSGNNNGIFSVEPFKSNKDLFQIWFVPSDSIKDIQFPDYITNSSLPEVFKNADVLLTSCRKKQQFNLVVHNNSLFSWTGEVGHAKNNYAYAFYNTENPHSLAISVHEFAHAFAGLTDEYDADSIGISPYAEQCYFSPFVNCEESYTGDKYTCQETIESYNDCLTNSLWSDQIGEGCGDPEKVDCDPTKKDYEIEVNCFLGCGRNKNLYRSTFSSGLRTIKTPMKLGPVNEKLVCRYIKVLTGVRQGECSKYQ